ncbi:MAG: AraC family transcriptional regulator [Alistipes sp.]|nr:AraC family transcriptional regulator [Alistipes sp.]
MEVRQESILSGENPFIVRETDLRILHGHPLRLQGAALILCKTGTAVITVDSRDYPVMRDSQLILLPDTVAVVENAGADFRVWVFYFTRRMFEDAHRQMDAGFLRYLKKHPAYNHTQASAKLARFQFGLLEALYSDAGNRFRSVIATNHLRNILLNTCDKIQRREGLPVKEGGGRREEIYHRFIRLIHKHCTGHRDVRFYADKLCISPRYLAAMTHSTLGETPKFTIDKHVIQEIKTLLSFSDMTLEQIAGKLNFPDQSYLGRFFKRHTGMSLNRYRLDAGVH